MRRIVIFAVLATAACGRAEPDMRGVDHGETLLSVSATGEAESSPDTARFEAGVNSYGSSARTASDANAKSVRDVIAALRGAGVDAKDIQTRALTVGRVEYGDRKGQYQASNVVAVTVRQVDAAGEAVTAATEAGANVLNGPNLSMDNGEAAVNSAYANAYRAARARAETYADAAGMQVTRVLRIRDGGGWQGNRSIPYATNDGLTAQVAAPPPVAMPRPEQGAPFMAGTTTSGVSVQVDFALEPA